jgi:L-alanine-DL-glutamate epimerase-like enolase superfamily enzyme
MADLSVVIVTHPLAKPFRIARGEKTEALGLSVSLNHQGKTGFGEATPYARYGETPQSCVDQIEVIRPAIVSAFGASGGSGDARQALQTLLPPGAARNALDLAIWDLEAKLSGKPVWQLAGLATPQSVDTAYTIVLDTPDIMAQAARTAPSRLLKLKLGGPTDISRVEAVANARPDARLIIDGNEALSPTDLKDLLKRAERYRLALIEQPFPADADEALASLTGPVPIIADESAHTSGDIERLCRLYDGVNIKLDKAGGLTEALAMIGRARRSGLQVMVGCMVASSRATAPAVLLAGLADICDLDGPVWLKDEPGPRYVIENGQLEAPMGQPWGLGQ